MAVSLTDKVNEVSTKDHDSRRCYVVLSNFWAIAAEICERLEKKVIP